MCADRISVTFKVTSGNRFDVTLSPSLTVREAKVLVESHCDIPPQQQRYIFRGRILKDDETLESYKISNGNTIHLVRGRVETPKAAASPPSTSATVHDSTTTATGNTPKATVTDTTQANPLGGVSGGMPGVEGLTGNMADNMNPQFFQYLMSNSMIQSVMQEIMANPEFLRNVIQTNPFLNQVAGSNPLLQSTLSNPEFLRSAVNPSMFQAIMNLQQSLQNQDLQGGTGTNAYGCSPSIPGNPTPQTPTTTTAATTTGLPTDSQPFAPSDLQGMMGRILRDSDVLRQMETVFGNSQGNSDLPLENIMSRMFNNGQQPHGSPNTPSVVAATRFQTQLQQLEDMGFIDKEANLLALQQSGGDVNAAISWLLESGHGN